MKRPFVSRKKYEVPVQSIVVAQAKKDWVDIDIEVPEPLTQEAYDSIKRQLEEIAERFNVRSGGLYSSVYLSKIEAVLAELKKKIVPVNQGEDTTAGAIRSMEEGR